MYAPGQKVSHGRLYVRNLPKYWEAEHMIHWISKELHLAAPADVHMMTAKGSDMSSAYVHLKDQTMGQMRTYCEHMTGKFLCHKLTVAVISQDDRLVQQGQSNQATMSQEVKAEQFSDAPWKKARHVASWLKC